MAHPRKLLLLHKKSQINVWCPISHGPIKYSKSRKNCTNFADLKISSFCFSFSKVNASDCFKIKVQMIWFFFCWQSRKKIKAPDFQLFVFLLLATLSVLAMHVRTSRVRRSQISLSSFSKTRFRNGVQDKGIKVLFLPFSKTGFRNGVQDKGVKVRFLPFAKQVLTHF